MAETKKTMDHEEIRRWVEERGGRPATVEGTESNGYPGVLRIDYQGVGEDDKLRDISWDEFFEKFDEEQLAFVYQDETSSGDESRFAKLVRR